MKKHDQKGRVERIAVCVLSGKTRRKHVLSLLSYQHINTRVVERHHDTNRLRNQRKVRKIHSFATALHSHCWLSWFAVGL